MRSIAISLTVCLSSGMSLQPLVRPSPNILCMFHVAVARSSWGGVAICYVLPVSWMTSRLVVMGRISYFNSGAKFDVYECLVVVASVRLVGGMDNAHGRLEVLHDGTWGTVCGDFFNEQAATVVCNMLGHGYVLARASFRV